MQMFQNGCVVIVPRIIRKLFLRSAASEASKRSIFGKYARSYNTFNTFSTCSVLCLNGPSYEMEQSGVSDYLIYSFTYFTLTTMGTKPFCDDVIALKNNV